MTSTVPALHQKLLARLRADGLHFHLTSDGAQWTVVWSSERMEARAKKRGSNIPCGTERCFRLRLRSVRRENGSQPTNDDGPYDGPY